MATETITLTSEWFHLTDGNQSTFLQVDSGMVYWCDSNTQPAPGAAVHRLFDEIKFTPPLNVWIRTGPNSKTKVTVTVWG